MGQVAYSLAENLHSVRPCPAAAQSSNMPNQLKTLDFKDTFLDADHLKNSFPGREIEFTSVSGSETPMPPFRVTFPPPASAAGAEGEDGDGSSKKRDADGGAAGAAAAADPLLVESYVPPDPGPYPEVR